MKYEVNANDVALGIYDAEDAQGARDAAAQDAGYESESAMERRLECQSALIAVPMNNIDTTEISFDHFSKSKPVYFPFGHCIDLTSQPPGTAGLRRDEMYLFESEKGKKIESGIEYFAVRYENDGEDCHPMVVTSSKIVDGLPYASCAREVRVATIEDVDLPNWSGFNWGNNGLVVTGDDDLLSKARAVLKGEIANV